MIEKSFEKKTLPFGRFQKVPLENNAIKRKITFLKSLEKSFLNSKMLAENVLAP
jgi:hypothetical protein